MPDVIMPQMGESIVEGTVTKWLKKLGDRVQRDEPLFEISTDKVDTEIPSPAGGVLAEILVVEGQTVQVNTVVARIAEDGKTATAPAAIAAAPAPAPKPAAAAPPPPLAAAPAEREDEDVRSSPLVRRLAKEHSIDLREIQGSGQGGRISKKDVEDYLARRGAAAPALPPAPAAGDRVEKLSVMRQRIAEHMVLTKRLAPHVTTVHQVDATRIARLRERLKDQFLERHGVKLTFLPFFVRAAAAALQSFPVVNASLDGSNILYHGDIHIGIAVALDAGLIVPVIRHADRQNVAALQRAVEDLAGRARRKQLKPEEVHGGTFSISNYGSFGSLLATPAINQPQSAILGVGAVHKAPVVIDDAIAIRSICYLSLTFDHRLLDGAIADQFLGHLRGVVEEWAEEII